MGVDFNPSQPIYLQLIERIANLIVRGELAPGEKLPSVRDMAVQYTVNPNTMQRVYAELETQGIVDVRRGEGTFVTQDRAHLDRLRRRLEHARIACFVDDMRALGVQPEDVIAALQAYIDQSTPAE